MESQNYTNHKRYYATHHFIYLPLLAVLQIVGIWKSFSDEQYGLVWQLFSVVIFQLLFLAIMLRQHYALGNQNRIIILEFKQRYFELFGKRSDEVAEKLSFDQIAALRFTYDDEFKILLERTMNKNLSGDTIKKAITRWKPDFQRV